MNSCPLRIARFTLSSSFKLEGVQITVLNTHSSHILDLWQSLVYVCDVFVLLAICAPGLCGCLGMSNAAGRAYENILQELLRGNYLTGWGKLHKLVTNTGIFFFLTRALLWAILVKVKSPVRKNEDHFHLCYLVSRKWDQSSFHCSNVECFSQRRVECVSHSDCNRNQNKCFFVIFNCGLCFWSYCGCFVDISRGSK